MENESEKFNYRKIKFEIIIQYIELLQVHHDS
jgi:hypothetical protein